MVDISSYHPKIRRNKGFTLIELLIVLSIIALLLTISVPKYFQSIDTAKEAVLIENLKTTRESIDKFYGDTGRYPYSLDELVEKKYLRSKPIDPISLLPLKVISPSTTDQGNVYDIKSTANGSTKQGVMFSDL
jgi:general secretion pathway protein G